MRGRYWRQVRAVVIGWLLCQQQRRSMVEGLLVLALHLSHLNLSNCHRLTKTVLFSNSDFVLASHNVLV